MTLSGLIRTPMGNLGQYLIIDVQHEAHYGVGVRSTNWSLSKQTEDHCP